jgi:hypothetical protein
MVTKVQNVVSSLRDVLTRKLEEQKMLQMEKLSRKFLILGVFAILDGMSLKKL